jgi:hypothetical protein
MMHEDDRLALEEAMKLAREDRQQAAQLDEKLADGEPWEQVALVRRLSLPDALAESETLARAASRRGRTRRERER